MGLLDQFLNQPGGGLLGSMLVPEPKYQPQIAALQGFLQQQQQPMPQLAPPANMFGMAGSMQPPAAMSAPPLQGPTEVGAPQFAPPVMPIGQQQPPLTDVSAQSRAPQQQQFMPPQQQAEEPSFLDRLAAGTNNLMTGTNPLAGLVNSVSGFATGHRTDAQGLQLQQQLATYKSLVASGVPDPLAHAATLNPEILKTIAPAYFDTAPKLQETGTDPFTGDKKFSIYQPNKQTLTPVGGGAQAAGGAQSPSAFGEAVKAGVSGEDLYQHMPAPMAATVKAMLEGRMPPPSTVAMRSPATIALINAANAIDPSFDATTWKSRNTFNTQLGSASPSTVGGQKTLMGTSLGHLGELAEAATALNNSNGFGLAPLGKLINAGSQLTTEQAAKANKLNETVARFSGEVGKLYSGSSGGGVHEREETRNRFGASMTSSELAAALEASRDLISSKLQALENQRDEVYGPNAKNKIDFLGQSGRSALEKINASIEKLKGGAQTQGAAPKFSEGATATNPQTGQKIIFKNGAWGAAQ